LTLPDVRVALPVLLISGLTTGTDVMRGEETEIIGLFSQPDYAGYRGNAVLLLPGTHAKHVRIANGRITTFATYMTGELFAVLAEHSILRFSLAAEDTGDGAEDFADGVRDAGTAPLSRVLFHVRARQLLDNCSPARNRAYLSGVLIGTEAHGLRATCPADTPVLLCAGSRLADAYRRAFAVLGMAERIIPVPAAVMDQAVVWGHRALLTGKDAYERGI